MIAQRELPALADGHRLRTEPGAAWAPYQAGPGRPWDLRLAGHLHRRAGFGGNWQELQAAVREGPQRAVDRVLKPDDDPAEFDRTMDELEFSSIDPASGSADEVRQWWLRRMLQTPRPLSEKMALFWHSHFGVHGGRVADGRAMHRHVKLLRTHALGRFSDLLGALVHDPALLISLDLGANPRVQPSLNLARPLLEVFTLGAGVASDRDVRETARALTGWSVLRRQLRQLPHEHDGGTKTILGQTGAWKGEDVVRILLAQRATARHLVGKLYRWLISESEEPSEELLAPLVQGFSRDYDTARLVERMLRSNLFFSTAAYRQRIKGPIEFALGIARPMEGLIPTAPLGQALASLGQDLAYAPTMHGWHGGPIWITPVTLIGRANMAESLLAAGEPYRDKLNPWALARRRGQSSAKEARQFFFDLLLQGDAEPDMAELPRGIVDGPEAARVAWLRGVVRQIVALPEFHLA